MYKNDNKITVFFTGVIIALVSLFAPLSQALADTQNITANATNYGFNVTPTSNAGGIHLNTSVALNTYRGYIQFTIPSDICNITVDSVTLKNTLNGGSAGNFQTYRSNTHFSGGTVTWDTPWTTPGGDLDALLATTAVTSGTDVPTFTGETATAGQEYTLILKEEVESGSQSGRYAYYEALGEGSNPPLLHITYDTSCGGGSSSSSSSSGGISGTTTINFNPNQDYFNGIILFMLGFFGIIFLFHRRK